MENSTDVMDEGRQQTEESLVDDSQDKTSDIDTTEAFNEIFQGKTTFDSWEEFITPFELFQRMTNSAFKPKSTERVDFVNEKKKAHEKIPEKIVYTAVSLICQHFGHGVRKEGSLRKRESYVGQDCEAYIKLSYKKGVLQILKHNLVHTNHSLDKSTPMRNIRPVIFNDELDILVCRVALDCNVFENRVATANWRNAVSQLSEADPKMEHLTRRMLKKRLHFLMERYGANCEGREPLEGDEMGQILHQLLTQKEVLMASAGTGKRGRKRKNLVVTTTPKKRGRGRPKKNLEGEEEGWDNDDSTAIYAGLDNDDDYGGATTVDDEDDNGGKRNGKNCFVSSSDIRSLLRYLQKRDDNSQRIEWEKVQLRKEELELQKQKFEFEKEERTTLMEVLKIQSQLIATINKKSSQAEASKGVSREYILNKDGTLQPVIPDSYEHRPTAVPVQATPSTPNRGLAPHYTVVPQ